MPCMHAMHACRACMHARRYMWMYVYMHLERYSFIPKTAGELLAFASEFPDLSLSQKAFGVLLAFPGLKGFE